MTDVRLYHTDDGGEIEIVNGSVTMDRVGLESAVYISLFGGNAHDRGLAADDHLTWWGNINEPVAERRLRSETQALLEDLPLVPASLRLYEGAATRDLAWMVPSIASTVRVTATMPAMNAVKLRVEIEIGNETIALEYTHQGT